MKRILVSLYAIFIMQAINAQNQNFTGNWRINMEKSKFGEAPSFVVPVEITVNQTPDTIFLSVVNFDDNENKTTASAKYSLNGKETERTYGQDLKLVGSFQLSNDKKQLKKAQRIVASGQSEPIRKIIEVWTLSEDGNALTIQQTVSIANTEGYSVKAVYDKK